MCQESLRLKSNDAVSLLRTAYIFSPSFAVWQCVLSSEAAIAVAATPFAITFSLTS